jgi:hypothetical protein
VLLAVSERFRTALLNLSDYRDIPTKQLKHMARQLPRRVHFADRVTTVAFLLGARQIDVR